MKKVPVTVEFTVPAHVTEAELTGFMDDALSDAVEAENEDPQYTDSESWMLGQAMIRGA